ncbi:ArsR/SmtB family transcription factor [Streptomyces sp. NPDC093065]|uniref:ArsR/SmtB family transcription factor n=1 Tax=Streptomyces sp. NPDC093065 TaxID=3366021 RepID=UPI00381AA746
MLRIHFTGADLENVRLARRPDLLWEVVCSVCRLQTREEPLAFDAWRRTAGTLLRRGGAAGRSALALRSLVPNAAYFPDFLTPPSQDAADDLQVSVDRVLTTPRRRLRQEMTLLAADGARPWAGAALARGDARALTELGGHLRTYYEQFVAPLWDRVHAATTADLTLRTRALLDGGNHALLNSLRPMAVWESPVLTVDYPVDRDLHLGGRGLLLVPSYFCARRPVALADDGLRPVLVCPVERTFSWSTASPRTLARLLGATRAALLYETAAREATTSELARAVGASLPSASQQLAALRDGGLVVSRRDGKCVRHTATPLGHQLLTGR